MANPIAAELSELNISMCVGKSIIKDVKDGRKDFIKDKEIRKEIIKDKEPVIKEKEIRKELLPDNKALKDLRDSVSKPVRRSRGLGRPSRSLGAGPPWSSGWPRWKQARGSGTGPGRRVVSGSGQPGQQPGSGKAIVATSGAASRSGRPDG